jgi:hypothetical protein
MKVAGKGILEALGAMFAADGGGERWLLSAIAGAGMVLIPRRR